MIFVACTAVALGWLPTVWQGIRYRAGPVRGWSYSPFRPLEENPLYRSTRSVVATGLYTLAGVACPWMLYLLYRSRPPGRLCALGRMRRPGTIACLASTVVLALELIRVTVGPRRGSPLLNVADEAGAHKVWIRQIYPDFSQGQGAHDPFFKMLYGLPRHAGFVVAGAWLILAFARAWRPEPSWTDRAGRALGIFWILAALHFFLFPL
jgi:hypothetical protein